MNELLTDVSTQLIQRLLSTGQQLVLAESCTAGLVASSLAGVPSASSVFVGSAVVYQERTKQQWLEIAPSHFEEFDVVSSETSQAMASQILQQTPWATVSASITGHLGPNAPAELDGIAWATVIVKSGHAPQAVRTQKLVLDQHASEKLTPLQVRHQRQQEAAKQLIELVGQVLNDAH